MADYSRALSLTALVAAAVAWALPGVSSALGGAAGGKAQFERY